MVLNYSHRFPSTTHDGGDHDELHQRGQHALVLHLSMMDICLSFQDIIAAIQIASVFNTCISNALKTTASVMGAEEVEAAVATGDAVPKTSPFSNGRDSSAVDFVPPILGRFEFHTDGVCFSLVNDSPGYYLPLVQLRVPELEASGVARPDGIHAHLMTTIEADYHNRSVMEWEPLLESWSFRAEIGAETEHRQFSFAIYSDSMLDLNLTQAAMNNLTIGAQCLQSHLLSSLQNIGPQLSAKASKFSRFRIWNQTGSRMRFRTCASSMSDVHSETSSLFSDDDYERSESNEDAMEMYENLEVGEQRELEIHQFVRGGNRRNWTYSCPSVTILVQGPNNEEFEYWSPLSNIALDSGAGEIYYHILHRNQATSVNLGSGTAPSPSPTPRASMPSISSRMHYQTYVSTHVRDAGNGSGSALIVRSPVVVENLSSFPVEIRYEAHLFSLQLIIIIILTSVLCCCIGLSPMRRHQYPCITKSSNLANMYRCRFGSWASLSSHRFYKSAPCFRVGSCMRLRHPYRARSCKI